MHFHFICAGAKKEYIYFPLPLICVLANIIANIIYLIFINKNNIICDRVSKEIIMLIKSPGFFTVSWKNPLTCLRIIWKNEIEK